MSKITKIPLEIRNFFSEKRRSAVMDSFTHLLENVNLDCRSLGGMNISVASILCNKRALTLRWFCPKPDVWSKKGCTVFLFVTRRHQLAKGDIPHNQLASNESDNAERSQEKQIADSTDSR